jgi:hypothetical protein
MMAVSKEQCMELILLCGDLSQREAAEMFSTSCIFGVIYIETPIFRVGSGLGHSI